MVKSPQLDLAQGCNVKRVLIVAGGTGGHIFPALVIAKAFQEKDIDIQWLGSKVGLERDLVSPHFPVTFVNVNAIRRNGFLAKLLAPFRILQATLQALCAIRTLKPDLVLGMGGFVAGPAGVAAKLLRIPLVIHEQNSVAGVTNRILARLANAVLSGFPNAFPTRVRATVVGNPVRPEIAQINAPAERLRDRDGPLRVFVLGGSQGARAINHLMVDVLKTFPNADQIDLWHQTGKLDHQKIKAAYADVHATVKTQAFIDDIAQAYAWADVMVCRSGALTVAELSAAGVASILIPFPFAVDDHQYFNGKYLADNSAAMIVRQQDMTVEHLSELLQSFLDDRRTLLMMAEKAKQLHHPDAVANMVDACYKAEEKAKGVCCDDIG